MLNKVKVIVSERNGTELEYNEEASPLSDILLCAGLSLYDLNIIGGSDNPAVIGIDAPIGSYYLQNNHKIFQKQGTADTDWVIIIYGPKWLILDNTKLPAFTQYVIHNRPLIVLATIYLELGSDIILL